MADPRTRAARRGCLILIAGIVAVSVAAVLANRWISGTGAPVEVIRVQTAAMVEDALAPGTVTGFSIAAIYPRRERGSVSVDTWQVEGSLTAGAGNYSPLSGEFLAVVKAVCRDYDDIGCWELRRLSVAGRAIR